MTSTSTDHSVPHPETFERFLVYVPMLTRWVRSRVARLADSDDIVQQTLFQAFRHCRDFRYESSPGTWLCAIALNQIRAFGRGRRVSTFSLEADCTILSIRDPRVSALSELERDETESELHAAISRLSKEYRDVVHLRDFAGLSINDTSQQLAISVTAVKSRHHRARKKLHNILRKPLLSQL